MPRVRRLAGAATAVLLVGCVAAQPDACPSNTTCGQAPPGLLTLAAELVPSAVSSLSPQEIPLLSFDDQGSVTVALAATVAVRGLVLGANDQPVPAQVVLSRPSLVPGRPDVIQQTTTSEDTGGGGAGSFSFDVPASPGALFTLTVIPRAPADADQAPAVWQFPVEQADKMRILCLSTTPRSKMCPSSGAEPPTLSGRVLSPYGGGAGGVHVVAVDPSSGQPRSSVAVTSPGGAFLLHLTQSLSLSAPLRVIATPDPTQELPTLTRDAVPGSSGRACLKNADCGGGLSCALETQRCQIDLRMPGLPSPKQFSIPIGGAGPNGEEVTLVGARVDFKSDLSVNGEPTRASFAASVLTDERGLATVDLIPGDGKANRDYAVEITPPADSMLARSPLAVSVGSAGGVLGSVRLGLRPQLHGLLVTASGQPVAGATVSAQVAATAVTLGTESAHSAATPETTTSPDGSFAVRLDPGSYDIELTPPPQLALARWSIDNRAIEGDDVDLHTVPLPKGVLTQIAVLGPDGAAATGVEVRVYAVAWADPRACPPGRGGCPLPARLRGQALTGNDGLAPLLLPSPEGLPLR